MWQAIRLSDEYKMFHDKLLQYQWLSKNGYPHAKVYKIVTSNTLKMRDIEYPCVLKPVHGAATIGVQLISPDSKKGYQNLRSSFSYKNKELPKIMKAVCQERNWADRWMIEELLLKDGKPPYEYKCHIFDKTELIGINYKYGGKDLRNWYDRDWMPVEVGRKDEHIDLQIIPSSKKAEILKLAEDIASKINHPFRRIDIFDTDKGLMVGEINIWEGNPSFNGYWDIKLGQIWEERERKLCQSTQ